MFFELVDISKSNIEFSASKSRILVEKARITNPILQSKFLRSNSMS